VHAGEGEAALVRRALAELRAQVGALERAAAEGGEVGAECATARAGAAS
jgi:hypothetical protein